MQVCGLEIFSYLRFEHSPQGRSNGVVLQAYLVYGLYLQLVRAWQELRWPTADDKDPENDATSQGMQIQIDSNKSVESDV
jgi:hypothetical protein